MSIFSSIGTLASPTLLGFMFPAVGYTKGLTFSSGMMFLSFFCGLLYFPQPFKSENEQHLPSSTSTSTSTSLPKQITLKIREKKQGIFCVNSEWNIGHQRQSEKFANHFGYEEGQEAISCNIPAALQTCDDEDNPDNLPMATSLSVVLNMMDDNRRKKIEQTGDQKVVNSEDKFEKNWQHLSSSLSLYDLLSNLHGASIADLLEHTPTRGKMRELFRRPSAVIFLIGELLGYASYIAFSANLADFVRHKVQLSEDVYTFALLLFGVSLLTTQVAYIIVSEYVILSSTLVHTISSFGMASVMFVLPQIPKETESLNALMIMFGMFVALNQCSIHGCYVEVTSVELASLILAASSLCSGVGSLMGSYGVSYLQVEVNIKAGIYVAGGLMVISSLSLLPMGILYMLTAKVYSNVSEAPNAYPTGYKPQVDSTGR